MYPLRCALAGSNHVWNGFCWEQSIRKWSRKSTKHNRQLINWHDNETMGKLLLQWSAAGNIIIEQQMSWSKPVSPLSDLTSKAKPSSMRPYLVRLARLQPPISCDGTSSVIAKWLSWKYKRPRPARRRLPLGMLILHLNVVTGEKKKKKQVC